MIQSLISLLTQFVQASGGGGHHEAGIPTVVFYQAINVLIFVGILVWFGKDKVRAVFQQRLAEFHRLAQETEKARKDLEHQKEDIVRRTAKLKETSQQSLQDAVKDSEKFLREEIEKAKKTALKLNSDVELQIAADQQKLFEKLRVETLELSVAAAESDIGTIDSAEKNHINKRVQQRIEGAIL